LWPTSDPGPKQPCRAAYCYSNCTLAGALRLKLLSTKVLETWQKK
jgi:hypothetical protein